MTHAEHRALWRTEHYRNLVCRLSDELHSDGCTGVPEFYRPGCLEHDIAYRTHKDPLGHDITKAEADTRMRWYIQYESPFGVLSPMSWWRWAYVAAFAQSAWDHE